MAAMTTLYLVRHGETEWNRIGRWQGHIDVPLSARGREQAEALAQRLIEEPVRFDWLYASDLQRAYETAQIVGQALQMPIQSLPLLREINLGAWSGLTRAEIMERFPGAFNTMHYAPDAETNEAFATRVREALCQLVQQHQGQAILVITHGGVVRAMLRTINAMQGQPDAAVPLIENTSITELQLRNNQWHVVRASDSEHLEREEVPDAPVPRDEGNLLA